VRVAISGCRLSGPALACWLHQYGNEVVLVEQAPQLVTGGYMINCWGRPAVGGFNPPQAALAEDFVNMSGGGAWYAWPPVLYE